MSKIEKLPEAGEFAKKGNVSSIGRGQTKDTERDGFAVAKIMASRGVNPLAIGDVHHVDNEKAQKIVNAAEAFNVAMKTKSAQRA